MSCVSLLFYGKKLLISFCVFREVLDGVLMCRIL